MTVQVEVMSMSSEGDYQSLVERAIGTSLSHTLAWRDVLLDLGMGEPVYWLAYQEEELLGALPTFVCRTELGTVVNSLPFVQSTGGIIGSPDLDKEVLANLARKLFERVLEWSRASGVSTVCIIGSAFLDQQYATSFPVQPDFCAERSIQVLDLEQAIPFPKTVRWMVNRAEQLKPVMKESSSLDDARLVYDLYAGNMRRIGVVPHPWSIYRSIFNHAAPRGWTRFIWAEVENEPVAALILMWHGNTVDYFSVGSTEFGRRTYMNSWLCSQQINLAKKEGVRWWNWMASPSKPVYDFKKQWGSLDKAYPIWLWRLGDVTAWKSLSSAELSAAFPGYFALPYDWLLPIERGK